MRIAVVGKPGAGKTTQARRLSRLFVVPHVSTDDMLRSEIKAGSKLNDPVRAPLETTQLVPDEVVIELVRDRVSGCEAARSGFILDGFPRTLAQADALPSLGVPDAALWLVISTGEVTKRLLARRVCSDCGAVYSTDRHAPRVAGICDVCYGEVTSCAGDSETAIRQRLESYQRETAPLLRWFEEHGRVSVVSGLGDPRTVTERLLGAVNPQVRTG